MTFKLTPSLLDVGGTLVEAYERISRATKDAKAAVGKGETEEVKAQIGIASVEEYITMAVTDVGKNEMGVFDLSQFDQPMRLHSLYIDDPQFDSVRVELFLPDDTQILRQSFGRNKTPVQFPTAPLPNNVVIKITALKDVKYMQIVLVPVVILAAISGTKELNMVA